MFPFEVFEWKIFSNGEFQNLGYSYLKIFLPEVLSEFQIGPLPYLKYFEKRIPRNTFFTEFFSFFRFLFRSHRNPYLKKKIIMVQAVVNP